MTVISLLRTVCAALLLAVPAMAKPVVVIDAGHGGHDRGGMPGQRVPEKGYCLDVAKRLESALKSAGYRTVMTRRSDVFVTLGTRCAIANQYGNAIFISIHFNGASNPDASGIETYYCSGRASAALASAIHRQVLSATGAEDRRVRSRRFHVLRETRVPAVLCELGFLTNRGEARKVSSSSYRQRLADAIARAVRSRY
jgi:N-acetylmuramoyl-L-alanine amidase